MFRFIVIRMNSVPIKSNYPSFSGYRLLAIIELVELYAFFNVVC